MSDHASNDRARAERAERMEQALGLRLSGATFAAIGTAMGVNKSTAKRYVDDAIAGVTREKATELVVIENEMLNRAQRAIWADVLAGQLGAVDRFVRISERRAKLNGLDAPQRVDLGASDVDLGSVVRELEEAARAQVAAELDAAVDTNE